MWLAPLCLILQTVAGAQIPLVAPPARLTWTMLGPFPLGTREGPLLPPLAPDLTLDRHPSPLADGAYVSPRVVEEDADGWMQVGDDEPAVRWKEMKETGGWSILQHQRSYTRELRVPRSADSPTSIFALSLTAGAEFSLRRTSSNSTPTWYHGNMYSYEHVPPHYVELDSGATYALSVTYHHDIRIAGDVAAVGDDGVPRSKWKLDVQRVEDDQAVAEPERSVVPSVLRGWTMGSVVGVEVRNPSRKAVEISGVFTTNPLFSLSLNRTVLSPFQTRLVSIHLEQHAEIITSDDLGSYALATVLSLSSGSDISLTLHLPVTSAAGPITSTFLSNTQTPSYSLYTPPSSPALKPAGTILALHGAGLDPAKAPEWTSSIPQRPSEWIVWPIGLTPWGYDWHGGTLHDVKTAVAHLEDLKILWVNALSLDDGALESTVDSRIAVVGHSNGGQGAWYFLARFPDEVLGGVPASGYVKIQDYVPYSFSVGRHFRDPSLTGILDAALAPFDNDVHASNLAGLPILNRHGGADDNVPVYHSRQLVSAVERWSGNASSISYSEILDAGHWFDTIFDAAEVATFLDSLFADKPQPTQDDFEFTLTTANPDETGSKNGFKITELETPGRLARITVRIYSDPNTLETNIFLKTRSVLSFSVDRALLTARLCVRPTTLTIDSRPPVALLPDNSTEAFTLDHLSPHLAPIASSSRPRRYGPLLAILSSPLPLQIIVGTTGSAETQRHLRSIATRIAHDAYLYGKVNSIILLDSDVGREVAPGNVVLLGDSFTNSAVKQFSAEWPVPVTFVALGAFAVETETFQASGQGLLFLVPHPSHPSDLALVLAGTDAIGLESAVRLFPVRTGVTVPDWVVTSAVPTAGGVEAAGFWDRQWKLSSKMSFL